MNFLKSVLVLLLIFSFSSCVFGADPVIIDTGLAEQVKTFDKIEKISTLQLSATAVITPTDIVSTNTASVYYLPTAGSFEYPIELEVQNFSAASITYNIYSTSATGIDVPDYTDPALMTSTGVLNASNKSSKMVFYQAPNVSFASTDTATASFIIRTIKNYRKR